VAFVCFGLTGGLASGKTTVARRLQARGVPVVDADDLAREAVAPGSPALLDIERTFGSSVLTASGELDRARLAALAFGDETSRRRLEAIVHPRIAVLSREHIDRLRESGHRVVCYDAALLVESGRAHEFRPLLVVSAPEELQIARAVKRGLSEPAARARLAAQLPLAQKAAVADFVIDNATTLADLEARTDDVLDAILRTAGLDPAAYPRPSQ
jgi:dephospho-CoA kinase